MELAKDVAAGIFLKIEPLQNMVLIKVMQQLMQLFLIKLLFKNLLSQRIYCCINDNGYFKSK